MKCRVNNYLKRLVCLLVSVAFLLSSNVMPYKYVMASGENDIEETKENFDSYTPIYTIEDLMGINSDPTGNYILMCDIDMTEETTEGGSYDTGHGWTPLNSFSGVFDGNGHRIIGMNIYNYDKDCAGLFSAVKGSVKNLGIVDCNINTPNTSYVGGITGYLSGGTITGCYVTGNVIGEYAGGLVGYFISYSGSNSAVLNCYNNASTVESKYGGGLIGYYAYNYGGSGDYGKISCCYNAGKADEAIEGYGDSYIRYAIENYYYRSDYSAVVSYDDCYSLTDSMMKVQSSFVGFNFNNVWEIDKNSTYPYPQLKENRHHRVSSVVLINDIVKTEYYQGGAIDLNGGVISVTYEDGKNAVIYPTNNMLANYDMMQLGEQTVSIIYGGKTVNFIIKVNPVEAENIEIISDSLTVKKGDTIQLSTQFTPVNTTDKSVTWSSNNEDVASIDENGLVTAKKIGSVEITATTAETISSTIILNVIVDCTSIEMSRTYTMYVGISDAELPVKISPVDCTEKIMWSSSNEAVATVTDGKITSHIVGKTTITAKTSKGIVEKCTLYVEQAKDDIDDSKEVIWETETETNDYTPIYTIEDLMGINSDPTGNYILMCDIDMTEETTEGGSYDTGHGWTPLNSFSGVFDGNGHRIIGMNIYNYDEDCTGLFSAVKGTVKNLGIVDCNINAPNTSYVGGITGYLSGGTITGCYVTGNVIGEYAGGLVGYFISYSGSNSAVLNCYNNASTEESKYGGGLIGYYAYNYGGYGDYGKISCCYNAGKSNEAIEGYGDSYIRYAIENYYYRSDYSAVVSYDDCYSLTDSMMKAQSSFVGFDFNDVWEIDKNSTYPYPQLKENRHDRVQGITLESATSKTEYYQGDELNLSGGKLKVVYENNHSVVLELKNSMLCGYDMMQLGKQTIDVSYGGLEVSFNINVKEIYANSVEIKSNVDVVERGKTIALRADIKPQNTTNKNVTWSSSNENIATVNSSGQVTGKRIGTVTIFAETSNGLKDEYNLSVVVSCTSISMESSIVIGKGLQKNLTAKMLPVDTTDTITWTSSNEDVASVIDGVVNGNVAGTATITAKATGGVSVQCVVTVTSRVNNFNNGQSDEITITDTVPAGYKGIYTIEDLASINSNLSGKYILMRDIDITSETATGGSWDTGMGWTPLNCFSGVLNGNGHRIIGMNIYGEAEHNMGLFSSVIGGIITNLAMVNCSIDGATENCGVIAGYISDSIISQCYVTGAIDFTNVDNECYAGGIAGYANESIIENNYNCVDITSTDIVTAGGIVGYADKTEIDYCYNMGQLTGIGNIGAICGDMFEGGIENSYYLNTSAEKGIGNGSNAVKSLTMAQMKIREMYVGFDFEEIWELDTNSEYMYPQIKFNRQDRIVGVDIVYSPKTDYERNEQLVLDDVVIKIIYEGEREKELSYSKDFILSNYDMSVLGEQLITLYYCGKSDSFTITIDKVSATAINIVADKNVIEKDSSMQLGVEIEPINAEDVAVTWTSSDSSICEVDETGIVTAKNEGTVNITATLNNGLIASYALSVVLSNKEQNNVTNQQDSLTHNSGNIISNSSDGNANQVNSSNILNFVNKQITVNKVTDITAKNVKGKKVKLKFKKVKNALLYEIRYSTNSKMKNAKIKKIKVANCTLSKLKKKKYYIQIRAVGRDLNNNALYGKWSKKVKVSVKK